MNGEEAPSGEPKSGKKVDVSKLASIIPPPSELRRGEEKKALEKRIRVKYDESLPKDVIKVASKLAEELNIASDDLVELVVAGRRKFVFKVVVEGGVDPNLALCHPEELRAKGVSDNSIATIRKYRQE